MFPIPCILIRFFFFCFYTALGSLSSSRSSLFPRLVFFISWCRVSASSVISLSLSFLSYFLPLLLSRKNLPVVDRVLARKWWKWLAHFVSRKHYPSPALFLFTSFFRFIFPFSPYFIPSTHLRHLHLILLSPPTKYNTSKIPFHFWSLFPSSFLCHAPSWCTEQLSLG